MTGLRYDVVVIGGGLSACEAAHAAAQMGCETLLLAADLGRLADLSLNARMGGPVRGILVREVEALGGLSGRAADAALLQIRLVNEARGPAHRALRAALDPDADAAPWVVAVRGAPPIRAQAVVLALGTAVHQHICVGRDGVWQRFL